ncbi:MAG: hypothetical protein NTX23_09475 [Candidatus Bipolaricaulota bacterium]|nr:hypothetical protein [Candidatus Bipolaricaulota bacterium]
MASPLPRLVRTPRGGPRTPCQAANREAVAFFFGNDGPFDLGEIDFAVERPVAPGWTASLAVVLKTASGTSVALGWSADL